MRSKFKKALAVLASAAMCGSMLLQFPSDTFEITLPVFAADGDDCTETDCTGTYTNGFCSANSAHYEAAVLNNNGTEDDTTDDYYEIGNAGQFFWFAEQVNAGDDSINNAVLTSDIDLENKAWTPIGNSTTPYTSTFDGADKSITNFKMNITTGGDWGLFGFVNNATVRNFSISGEVVSELTETPTEFNYGVFGQAT